MAGKGRAQTENRRLPHPRTHLSPSLSWLKEMVKLSGTGRQAVLLLKDTVQATAELIFPEERGTVSVVLLKEKLYTPVML